MTRTLGISGAQKAPSAGSLISSALRLPGDIEWSNESGLEWLPEACGPASRFLYCDAEQPDKDNSVVPDAMQARPFVIYYPEGCSPLAVDFSEWEARARNGLTAHESAALAQELMQSYGGVNLDLVTAATDVSAPSGTPNRIPQTIMGLIQAMVQCNYTGDIMFHAPAWTLPMFLLDTELTLTNGVYKLGHHTVIFDAGYPNAAPTDADAENEIGVDGVAWIYATSPVEYALGPVMEGGGAESKKGASARQNSVYVVAERAAIVRFDGCCVFAALAGVC